jgi:HlyD family secretion protein/macrolide-specific efflux system membrane fusion protein
LTNRTWFRVRLVRGRSKLLAVLVVIVLVTSVVWAGSNLFGSSSPQYRTVAASMGTVQQTTSLSGTIEPVTQANLNFSTSGTVATVGVKVGQKVREGVVVATLQNADLSAQVDQAKSSLDAAQSTLQGDESPSGSSVVADETAVTTAQNTLTDDETALSDASTTNQMSLTEAQGTAQSAQTTLSNESLQLENDQSTLSAMRAKESIDCQGDALAGSSTCTSDENAVTSDETLVTNDANNVSNDRSQAVSDENSVTSTQLANTKTMQQDRRQVATDTSQLAGARAKLQTARDGTYADQLVSDRASVASAESSLSTAVQNLAGAQLISPISGTVIALNVTKGGTASADASTVGSPSSSSASGSSSPAVEIVSPGTFEVQATASDSQVSTIKVGDQVVITPSGATSIVLGTVTQVGTIATVSSGVVTFPVTIGVKGASPGLYEGASAHLTLFVLQVKNILTVPSSAVHTEGPRSFVYVLSGDKEVAHTVSVGAVGGSLTQIKAGLTIGQKVVLADLSANVPGVNSSSGGGPQKCPACSGNVRIIGPGSGFTSVNNGPKGG